MHIAVTIGMYNSSEILLITILFLAGFRNFLSDLDNFLEKNQFHKPSMTKIVAAYCVISLISLIFLEKLLLIALGFNFLTPFLIKLCGFLYKFMENGKLDKQILPITNKIILYMSAGNSIKSATEQALNSLNPKQASRIRLLLRHEASEVRLSIQNSKLKKFMQIYWYLLKNKHLALSLLRNFRKDLYVEANAKQRFQRAMSNIYVQVFVLFVLYVAALVYILPQSETLNLTILISFSLVIGGSLLFCLLLRSFKWSA